MTAERTEPPAPESKSELSDPPTPESKRGLADPPTPESKRGLSGGLPPVARQFVAGETPAEALEHVRTLNGRDVGALVNLLGSHSDGRSQAEADAAVYRSLVDHVGNAKLDAGITLKPTQIGLDLGEPVFREHLFEIADRASERKIPIWLDMEEPWTVDPTLAAFEDLVVEYEKVDTEYEKVDTEYEKVGVCVQANLKRTPGDLERLADVPGKVRLVKGGAYDVPASVGYREKPRIDRAYRESLRQAFEQFDGGIAVASHDPEMIGLAKHLHDVYGTDFEFQMLMGVRPDAQFDLAERYEVRQYVPYGERWKQWVLNRARNDLRFAARAVLGSSRIGSSR